MAIDWQPWSGHEYENLTATAVRVIRDHQVICEVIAGAWGKKF